MRISWSIGGLAMLATVYAISGSQAQTQPPSTPPILTESLVGGDLFLAYCAPCHGRGGRGDGPVAPALRVPPADLTAITRRNLGTFPADLVEGRLTGARGPEDSGAHGSTAMPVWGPIFTELDTSPVVARVRVENLVKYVESLQVP